MNHSMILMVADFNSLLSRTRVAFAGDYLANNTMGKSYGSGVSAAKQILAGAGSPQAHGSIGVQS